ncbi:MAG: hypothetical protein K0R39_51 [Symbiobacteriaceae bacterium]|jgi:hypothetical protein|nr:hypothetical protein [Symbiobacteriaceae bacterium]
MKHRIWPVAAAALLLAAGAASPALAGGGLPVITSLRAGDTDVTIYGDSLLMHTGTNTLTVEATGLHDSHGPELSLIGPDGTTLSVPLEPLHIVAGPDGGHGDSHGSSGHGDDHATAAADAVWFRGKVAVRTTGYWKVQFHMDGKTVTDEVKVVENGPSRAYLAFTGLAMGGTIVYGAIVRRRQPNGRR